MQFIGGSRECHGRSPLWPIFFFICMQLSGKMVKWLNARLAPPPLPSGLVPPLGNSGSAVGTYGYRALTTWARRPILVSRFDTVATGEFVCMRVWLNVCTTVIKTVFQRAPGNHLLWSILKVYLLPGLFK